MIAKKTGMKVARDRPKQIADRITREILLNLNLVKKIAVLLYAKKMSHKNEDIIRILMKGLTKYKK